jgi:hypothetical protein
VAKSASSGLYSIGIATPVPTIILWNIHPHQPPYPVPPTKQLPFYPIRCFCDIFWGEANRDIANIYDNLSAHTDTCWSFVRTVIFFSRCPFGCRLAFLFGEVNLWWLRRHHRQQPYSLPLSVLSLALCSTIKHGG